MNTVNIEVSKLHPFAGHPFKVVDNEEMEQLTESIMQQGLLTPLVVRPLANHEYEVISGHRRLHACKKAGIKTVPAFVVEMDRDAAAIALVDSNLHREHILPSEKAFAYKLKMEAMKHQGQKKTPEEVLVDQMLAQVTSRQVVGKFETADLIADSESGRQVQRYIRLTNLIPGIMQKVDENRIALTPAVELSYLSEEEQTDLLEIMESEDCTPSLSQSIHLKQLSQAGQLDVDAIFRIMTQPKANQKERLKIPMERIRQYFPKSYTTAQMEETIVRLCEGYHKRRMSKER